MAETQTIQLSRSEIAELSMNVQTAPLSAATKALLSAILAAIQDVFTDPDSPVTVTVENASSLQDQFDAAFTPDSVDDSGIAAQGVKVTVTKVGKKTPQRETGL